MFRWASVIAAAITVILVVVAIAAVASDLPEWLRSEVTRLPLLRPGDEGEWVVRLQEALTAIGLDPGPVDGKMGPMTQDAVCKFQAEHNLNADGIVSSETWQALTAALLAAGSHPPDREQAGDGTPFESIPGRDDATGAAHGQDEYVVRAGDTLAGIARRFDMTVTDLIRINDLTDPDLIRIGQVLKVRALATQTSDSGDNGTPGVISADEHATEYVVQKGDTLAAIARRFDMSIARLTEINGIEDPDLITTGQIINVIVPLPGDDPPAFQEESAEYVVQKGDTLSAIARRFGMSVAELIELNRLADPDLIRTGQILMVKPQAVEGEGPVAVSPGTGIERTWHEGGWFTYLPPTPADGRGGEEERESGPDQPATAEPNPTRGTLALTFNDGPDRAATARILEILSIEGIRATFFVVGQDAAANPDLVRRMHADGHQIENHSYTHPDFTGGLSWGGMRTEISRTADLIMSLTGRRTRYFRPPFGSWDQAVTMAATREGHSMILWSNIGALDFPFPGTEELSSRIAKMAFPGAIIMLHANLPDTAEALPQIISALRERGFDFATLDQLPEDILPGMLYKTGG